MKTTSVESSNPVNCLSASVDYETDQKVQATISKEFADHTILCIAHRIKSVCLLTMLFLLYYMRSFRAHNSSRFFLLGPSSDTTGYASWMQARLRNSTHLRTYTRTQNLYSRVCAIAPVSLYLISVQRPRSGRSRRKVSNLTRGCGSLLFVPAKRAEQEKTYFREFQINLNHNLIQFFSARGHAHI